MVGHSYKERKSVASTSEFTTSAIVMLPDEEGDNWKNRLKSL